MDNRHLLLAIITFGNGLVKRYWKFTDLEHGEFATIAAKEAEKDLTEEIISIQEADQADLTEDKEKILDEMYTTISKVEVQTFDGWEVR